MKRSVLDGVVKYTCKNTEQLGILVEKTMCDIARVQFNTKRKYDRLPEDISNDISDTIGPVLKRMKLQHIGNLNTECDFLDTSNNSKLSVKTIMSGNKICPQNIGQCSLVSLSTKLSLDFSTKDVFKRHFMENKSEMLQNYLDNCFCCDTTIVYKFDRGCIYVIHRKGGVMFSQDLQFTTSKDLQTWNESNTIRLNISKSDNKPKSLGEIQIHNNRDCIKFRFNIDVLLSMIDRGYINLSYDVYNLKTKYKFKVEKQSVNTMPKLCFQSFNYIGSKMKLLDFIKQSISDYTGKSYKEVSGFADICSGTGVVAFDVMKGGCNNIMTNDIQHYAYVVSSVWCKTGIDVDKIRGIINDMNTQLSEIDLQNVNVNLTTDDFFVYKYYTEAGPDSRLYLTRLNGYKTDIVRQNIEELYRIKKVNEKEYRLLLKLLLYAVASVSNIASVYGAYLKSYKKVALKNLVLNVDLLDNLVDNVKDNRRIEHTSHNKSIVELLDADDLSKYEVVYMDPPYVANRSYHDNYHVLETISRYDNPKLKGKTGLRDVVDTKSKFCSKRDAFEEFKLVLSKIKSKYMFISYSSESIVSKDKMMELMTTTGWTDVRCYEKEYQRFKSNKNSDEKQSKLVVEYIFCGKRN
jgi:adenine-specific DNA-methyltransferase